MFEVVFTWLCIIGGIFYVVIRQLADLIDGSTHQVVDFTRVPSRQVKSTEVLWSIQDARTKLKTDLKLTSDTISFGEHQWILELKCMNGRVTVALERKNLSSISPCPDIHFGIGVKHANLGEHVSGWIDMIVKKEDYLDSISRKRWFGPRLHDMFRNAGTWMPGGVLTFYVRLSMHPAPFVVVRKDRHDNNNCFNNATDERRNSAPRSNVDMEEEMSSRLKVLGTLSQNLKDLYVNDKECDVTIKVKKETFRAHRLILKARTPVLSAMFSHNMLESETGEIRVDDCDPKAFAVFLLFLYSGAVDDLAIDNVIPVYYIADKYDLPDLKEECSRYMWSTLTIHSVSNVIALAVRHGESVLMERAVEFFLGNAENIFPTVEWQRFMIDNPTQANELVMKAINLYAKEKK